MSGRMLSLNRYVLELRGCLPLLWALGGASSPRGDSMLESNESGRKTAVQRSNSLQSKKDLASKYLLNSSASSSASASSGFGVKIAGMYPRGVLMVLTQASSPVGSGNESSNSAALFCFLYTQHFGARRRGWERRIHTILLLGTNIFRSTSPRHLEARLGGCGYPAL